MTPIACTSARIAAVWLSFLLFLVAAPAARASAGLDRCQRCHGETWIRERSPQALAAMVRAPEGGHQFRDPGNLGGLYVHTESFLGSAHGSLTCNDCHMGTDSLPHPQRVPSLSCTQCHGEQAHEVSMGLHAPGMPGTPSCTDCHGNAHSVRSVEGKRSFAGITEMVSRCASCHAGQGEDGFDPSQTFHDSIHGEAIFSKGLVLGPLCTDCHGAHRILPLEDPESPLHLTNVADTCGACHEGVQETYEQSVHGIHTLSGNGGAATCTHCHHSHGVRQDGPEFLNSVVAECSDCHLGLGESYLRSYHGKARQLGRGDVPVCSSCHGAHDIQPSSHPDSWTSEGNLKATCATCHPGANENFTKYIVHVDYTNPDEHPAVFFTFWGMTILLCTVVFVFVLHSLLWFQRTVIGRLRNPVPPHAKGRMVRRFSLVHRLTHGLIVISFMGLVATGFPLKYSYTEWAQKLTNALGGVYMMGLYHRIFAIMTFVYVLIHLCFLVNFFWKKCPAPRWRYLIGPNSMLPRWKDFKDAFAMLRWFFWLGPRPRFGRWTYFEKFDYWGEIWGVIVIGGSGLILWMPTFFTKWLPGWSLNVAMVIHSIEALLAASVIFLVHFFNTHLRPEKFPIDMTMWTGQISEEEMKEERPEEYENLVKANQLEEEIVEPMALRWRILGTILGMTAFLFGIFLIVLAIRTEILSLLH